MKGSREGQSECKCNPILELHGSDEDTFQPTPTTFLLVKMGCRLSKIDSDLVKFCSERKELIRAARDSRYSLAFAHMLYFRILQNVEMELKNFMEEALVIYSNSASDAGLDHQTVAAVSENSSLESNNNEEDDDLVTLTDYVHVGLNTSEPPTENVSGQVRPSDYYAATNARFFQHESGEPHHYVMDFPSNHVWNYQTHFSRPSSPRHHEISTWDYINPFNFVEDTFPNFYIQDSYETGFVSNDMDLREMMERDGIPDLEDELDDPVMEGTSDEEYLEMNEDLDECLYEAAALRDGHDVYPDQTKEVRCPIDGLTNIKNEKIDGIAKEDLESGFSSSASESLKVGEIKESETCYGEQESFQNEMQKSETCGRQHSPSQTDEIVVEFMSKMFVNSSRDIQEVLNEIKDASDNIIMHGTDISKMLGPYQPGVPLTKGLSCPSCIEGMAASSRETSSRRSIDRMLKMAKDASENVENDTFCNLPLTLEKLCIWENKLYEEVKVIPMFWLLLGLDYQEHSNSDAASVMNEEKLRENFDKVWRKMKKLDDKGAESSKVDASQLSLKRLTPRINVSISTVEGIARRTHKIRDEELQPQLCELIQRLHRMWKLMFEAHRQQVQAIIKVQANFEISCTTSDSSLRATQKLEAEILKLGTAFSDWIKSHRAFAGLLKNWLAKFFLQEPGEAPEENSSGSPRSLSTPAVFAICNDWHNAVERVSETDVLLALNNLKQLLHQLCQNLHEERHQRLKIEYLSSYHEKKIRKFCMESGVDWVQCASFIREADSTGTYETGFSSLHALYVSLRPIRIKLREANAKHEQVMKRANAAAANILQDGLAPLLEALESFSWEMFKAFEQVRIPNEASAQE
ncbi:hypothetical protein DH2020_015717 [Rehmannia glutinosa]|uniref:Uncharacterized protein n=1 Tax=Rehmannia glutinosa TaxID=99300 RepID=A0ABR0WUA3_REHGL